MKFIHTADLHLNATLTHASFKDARQHETRVQELRDAFFRLLDYVKKHEIEMLFIAGDMFDDANMRFFEMQALFKRLKETPAEVFLLIGNHDTFLHNDAYQSLIRESGVRLFDKDTRKHTLGSVDVYGLNTRDFTTSGLDALNQGLDASKENILLLHGDVTNAKDDHYLCDVKTLEATSFDYIALGHIHKHRFLRPHIAYSGNLEPLDFSETDPRGFIEGSVEDGRLQAAFHTFQSRAFLIHDLTIDEEDTKDTILMKARTLLEGNEATRAFNRLRIKGEHHPELALDTEWLKRVLEDGVYYVEIKDESVPSVSLEALKEAHEDDAIALLIEGYEQEKKPDEEDHEALMQAIRALLETRREDV
ncbi:MAG: exonuclease SbcCD subunit D [Candidatus Izemoplasmataceae bacterium]